jgi:diguanylate cyclase (GGDEF)-like protein/PAS domain S-box-containing protein
MLWDGIDARNQAQAATEKQATLLIQQLKIDQDAMIESNRQLLSVIAQFPSVMNPNSEKCNQLLAEMDVYGNRFTGLYVTSPAGEVFCAYPPLADPMNVIDREYFQQTIRTGKFYVSDFIIGRRTGKSVITLNYPVINSQGITVAIVSAAVDLDWINQNLSRVDLPEGSSITVMDRVGVILARFPNPNEWVGKRLQDNQVTQTILKSHGTGTIEGTGVDGAHYLYAFAPLQTAGRVSAYMAIEIPSRVAYADAFFSWQKKFVLLCVAAALALIVAWGGEEFFVGKSIAQLMKAARQLPLEKKEIKIDLNSGIREIDELGASFDQMAEQINRQRHELSLAEEKYRSLVEQIPAITYLIGIAGEGEILYLSPQADSLIGPVQTGRRGDFWRTHILPEDKPALLEKIAHLQVGQKLDVEYRLVNLEGHVRWVNDVCTIIPDENGVPSLLQGMVMDVTDRKKTGEQLARKVSEMACLQAITAACVRAKSVNELIQDTTRSVGEQLTVDNFGVLLTDPKTDTLYMHSAYQLPAGEPLIRIPIGEGVTGKTALDGIPRRIADVTVLPEYIHTSDGIRSELCIPIQVGDKIFGVINLESTQANAYSEYDEKLMIAIADQLALGLDRLRFEEELAAIATIDELTHIANRRGFLERGNKEFRRSIRQKAPISLIMFDLDKFKQINDEHGHPFGDKALQEVSDCCQKTLREIDVFGRLGGDEFVILLPNTDITGAQIVAERIRTTFMKDHHSISLTLSIGIGQITEINDCSLDDLIALADLALYEAKRNGRNQITVRQIKNKNDIPAQMSVYP